MLDRLLGNVLPNETADAGTLTPFGSVTATDEEQATKATKADRDVAARME